MVVKLYSVLFGFWKNLATHLERYALKRSYGYAPAADRPTCFASLSQKSKSWSEMRARIEKPKTINIVKVVQRH
jgi:hypothetical protein